MLDKLSSLACASFFVLIVLSSSIHADDNNWNLEVGVGAVYAPAYEGSDKYVFTPLPNASLSYKDGLFFVNLWEGIGSYFIQGENYKIGASIGLSPGRDVDKDKKNLRGMGDIEVGALGNIMGEYNFGSVQLGARVATGAEDYGLTARLKLGSTHLVSEQLMLMGGIGVTWADKDHMNTYFGVSSTQSIRSGHKRYEAESGFKSMGANVGAIYSFSENLDLRLVFNGEHLLGDAANSPLTKKEFNPSMFLSTNYRFSF